MSAQSKNQFLLSVNSIFVSKLFCRKLHDDCLFGRISVKTIVHVSYNAQCWQKSCSGGLVYPTIHDTVVSVLIEPSL